MFDGVKIFAATKQKEREELGETATRWIQERLDKIDIVDVFRPSKETPGIANQTFLVVLLSCLLPLIHHVRLLTPFQHLNQE